MKNLFLLVIVLFITSFAFSQENSNQKRINEISGKIEAALQKEDYETAAQLSKEKQLWEELEKALENENFERAAEINKQLKLEYTSDNAERIKALEEELEKAIANNDYEKAAALNKEKKIRLEIEEAAKSGNQEELKKLRKELNNLSSSTSVFSKESTKQQVVKTESLKTDDITGKYQNNYAIKRGFYLSFSLGGIVGSGHVVNKNYALNRLNSETLVSGIGGFYGIGGGYIFGKKNYGKRFRVTFDLLIFDYWMATGMNEFHTKYSYYNPNWEGSKDEIKMTNENLSLWAFDLANPGVKFGFAIDEKMGIEAKLHGGFSLNLQMFDSNVDSFGFNVSPEFLFRFGKIGMGFSYKYLLGFPGIGVGSMNYSQMMFKLNFSLAK